MLTSATVATILSSKAEIFGSTKKEITYPNGKKIKISHSPGLIVSLLTKPLIIISVGVAVGCLLWFMTIVWSRYKNSKIEQSIAQLKSSIEIEKLKKDDSSVNNLTEE